MVVIKVIPVQIDPNIGKCRTMNGQLLSSSKNENKFKKKMAKIK